MKIEVHLIQSFPPSCLNRDDTNTPKDCEFGGVRRARISSQCIKRSIREYFREHNTVEVGERTKRLRASLEERLSDLPAEQLPDALDAFLETYYTKMDSKQRKNTAVLLFLSPAEIDEAANCARSIWDELLDFGQQRRSQLDSVAAKKSHGAQKNKKGTKARDAGDTGAVERLDREAGDSTSPTTSEEEPAAPKDLPHPKPQKEIMERLQRAALSPDIALFGRMLAEQMSLRVDAACQVAHAISTHKTDLEMDFYTAVDDLNKDDSGAGMLGVTGFNSACFYRYALIDRPQLVKNLGGEDSADQAIEAFLHAVVEAIPTGKQNSMAAQNLPSFGLFVVRENGAPASLANAFVQPVPLQPADLVRSSIHHLTKYFGRLSTVYGDGGISSRAVFCVEGEDELNGLSGSRKETLQEAIQATMTAVKGGHA